MMHVAHSFYSPSHRRSGEARFNTPCSKVAAQLHGTQIVSAHRATSAYQRLKLISPGELLLATWSLSGLFRHFSQFNNHSDLLSDQRQLLLLTGPIVAGLLSLNVSDTSHRTGGAIDVTTVRTKSQSTN
jgi:hypothetical protein